MIHDIIQGVEHGMRGRRILVSHNQIAEKAIRLLNAHDIDVFFSPPYDPSDVVAKRAADLKIDGLMVRQGRIDEAVISASPNLKVIAKHGVGVDNVDIAAAAKLGLKAIVVLRGHDPDTYEGNLLLDHLLGAEVRWISSEDYRDHRMDIMHTIADEVLAKGQQAYVIPEGASSGIGAFGYFSALQEIVQQEQELGISFDAVIVAVGSGGTHGGLLLAQQLLPTSHRIIGINVCDDEDYFIKAITTVIEESAHYLDQSVTIPTEAIEIIDGYVGKGYAQSQPQELQCIKDLASLEGVILDPVYTGKAFYGLVEEIRKGTFQDLQNILFIHTGGLYGLFPHSASFEF